MRSRWMFGIVAAVLLAAGGCSKSGLVPVTVVVTLDGEPMDLATVMLTPETGTTGSTGSGTTDTTGKALIVNGQGQKGLAPGKYRAVVSKTNLKTGPGGIVDPSVTGAIDASSVKQEVAPKYSDPAQSTLVYTVEETATTIEIKLKGPEKKK